MASKQRKPTTAVLRFDPHSLNATLATIIANQASHAEEMRDCFAETKADLGLVKEQVLRTNGRVGVLELWRATSRAKLAGIAAAFGFVGSGVAWVITVMSDRNP